MRRRAEGRAPHARRERGFTLLEVLVAFIIAALALGVMFEGVLGGMRAASVASHMQEALVLARSRLAAAGAAVGSRIVPPGDQQGDDGNGFHWSVAIRPVASVAIPKLEEGQGPGPGVGQPPPPKATLYGITVTVTWKADGAQRQVRLASARLAAVPGAGA